MTRARNTADEVSLITAKGDLLAGSASGVQSKLAVGSNNTVLTADSSTATGLKWAAPAGGTDVWSLIATGSPSGSASTLSINTTGYKKIMIYGRQVGTSAGVSVYFRLNSNSSNYQVTRQLLYRNTSSQFTVNYIDYLSNGSELLACDNIAFTSNNDCIYNIWVDDLNVAGFKRFQSFAGYKVNSSNTEVTRIDQGIWSSTATVTSFDISVTGGANLNSGGIYYIYGAAA